MTHEYTLLVGGIVIPGPAEAAVSAMAWAEGVVIALGSDEAIRAISRGDSHVVDLHGAVVVPLAPDGEAALRSEATVGIGDPADLAVLDGDPRLAPDAAGRSAISTRAVIRRGHVVSGALPGG
jgi:hypothetical protein